MLLIFELLLLLHRFLGSAFESFVSGKACLFELLLELLLALSRSLLLSLSLGTLDLEALFLSEPLSLGLLSLDALSLSLFFGFTLCLLLCLSIVNDFLLAEGLNALLVVRQSAHSVQESSSWIVVH